MQYEEFTPLFGKPRSLTAEAAITASVSEELEIPMSGWVNNDFNRIPHVGLLPADIKHAHSLATLTLTSFYS